ncbi:ComF family protein [uncultured Jannaschia sp.]|uniref:ComF family protein n=1 Tax=uncultured Jannaschia sp. TaxID=293347 RepID=UPI00260958D3|nr:ComF family protein [uncultured Jannaschia sp.]
MASVMQRAGPVLRAGAKVAGTLRQALYPATCMMCDARVDVPGAMCPACWTDTPFLSGACCDLCAVPLPGQDEATRCDECLRVPRPWDEARAAILYGGTGRKLVLALKHGDRTELARGAGRWMARRARDLLTPETMIAPVPVHRWRLLRRRYNQAALLAMEVARHADATFAPMTLVRTRHTPMQDHRSVTDRAANVAGAIALGPMAEIEDRHVALVDDVYTTGATLTACAEALRRGGARRITVLALARVAKGR